MKVEIKKLTDCIYHLEFKKQSKLTRTMVRFQEHFESPEFRGKIFTMKEFKKWYKKMSKGKFSYYEDWVGFNIPSEILKPFYEGKFNPLSKKEQWFLDQFRGVEGKFYIIGTYVAKNKKANSDTLQHEIAHALFYTNDAYRAEVLAILEPLKLKKLKKSFAKDGDYHESVFTDECHAYIMGDLKWLRNTWEVKIGPFREAHEQLVKVFKKHYAA